MRSPSTKLLALAALLLALPCSAQLGSKGTQQHRHSSTSTGGNRLDPTTLNVAGAATFSGTTTVNAGITVFSSSADYRAVVKGVMTQVAATSATAASAINFHLVYSSYSSVIDCALAQNTSNGEFYLRFNGDSGLNYSWSAYRATGGTRDGSSGTGVGQCNLLLTASQLAGRAANVNVRIVREPFQSSAKMRATWHLSYQNSDDTTGEVIGTCRWNGSSGNDTLTVNLVASAGTMSGFCDLFAVVPLVKHQ